MSQAKPWLKHYDPHVKERLDYPKITLPASLEETARKHSDHPAMVFKNNTISYGEYFEMVLRFAAALQELGVKKGERVAVHLPNCPQFLISYNAILRIGAIVVPCNPVYTAREMKHQLCDSGSEYMITLSSLYPLVKQIRKETPLRHVIVAQIKTFFPPVLRLLFALLMEKKGGHRVDISGEENTYWFSDLMKKAPPKPRPVKVNWDDTAVLMYTGGTTGVSKGAQLTHKNIYVNAYQVNAWVNAADREDSTLATLPLFHSYGMTCCMNAGAIIAGTTMLVLDPRNLDDILKTIDKHHPTLYPGVPAMYVALNNHPQVDKYDLSSIKVCVSGAAPLPVEVQQRFQEITGARLVEGFGLSEASPVTHANPIYGENRIGTIGLPYPDTEAKVVDVETGEKVLGVGEVGELCVRGPQVMKGYWNMPTETANTLRPDPKGGDPWLYTGDLAIMDQDGYFQIVDRKKDMILGAGGFNIYPREVEDVLYEHPKVLEAAAAGVLVSEKGERVKAFIVLKEGETATQEEIIEFCKQHLAPYKVPSLVEFRTSLPKTLVGKVLRRELIKEEAAEKGQGRGSPSHRL
ncbi:MAG: long-chain fatty acid--CoA ligase [Chloroflexota bacterium]